MIGNLWECWTIALLGRYFAAQFMMNGRRRKKQHRMRDAVGCHRIYQKIVGFWGRLMGPYQCQNIKYTVYASDWISSIDREPTTHASAYIINGTAAENKRPCWEPSNAWKFMTMHSGCFVESMDWCYERNFGPEGALHLDVLYFGMDYGQAYPVPLVACAPLCVVIHKKHLLKSILKMPKKNWDTAYERFPVFEWKCAISNDESMNS